MSLNIINDFQHEWEAFIEDTVEIRQKIIRITDSIVIPDEESNEVAIFTFKKMTCEDHWSIEKESQKFYFRGKDELKMTDYQEFKKQIITRLLINTSLFELKTKKGRLTKESSKRVLSLPAPLLQAVLYKYEKTVHMTEDEEDELEKQAAILFGKNSRGVENPCEAVSLYCNLGNFWEKFGINRKDIKDLPYKEYVQLKIMAAKENQTITAARNTNSNKPRNISMNGRLQKSRGIIVPDTGQV